MSFYELVSPLVDGEAVGAVFVGDEPPANPSGPVAEHYPDPEVYVWSAAANALRLRSVDELLTRAKAKKRAEIVAAAEAAYQSEIPSFAGVVVAAKFVPPNNTQYLNARELAVFNKIQAGYAKLNALLDRVDDPTTSTVEQVETIVW